VAALAADYVWQTTAEGDWIILMLQTGRFLMKTLQTVRQGKTMTGPCVYMSPVARPGFQLQQAAPRRATRVEDFLNLDYLRSLFEYRALVHVFTVGEELAAAKKAGSGEGPNSDSWNSVAVQLTEAVKVHCWAFMLRNFVAAVHTTEDIPCKNVLQRLCALFALTSLTEDQWAGMPSLGVKEVQLQRQALTAVLDALRPDMVALADAFDLPDRVLNSTLGRYDGNVYEALYEAAKRSPLNQRDPFLGYEDVLRPRLDLEYLSSPNATLQSNL